MANDDARRSITLSLLTDTAVACDNWVEHIAPADTCHEGMVAPSEEEAFQSTKRSSINIEITYVY